MVYIPFPKMRLLVLALTTLVMRVYTINESVLGGLYWCRTLCLCDKETRTEAHCFNSKDIYTLVQIDNRIVRQLENIHYNLKEKLTWCNDTCLCHKNSGKEFKCGDPENMVTILDIAPHLAPYFEQNVYKPEISYGIHEHNLLEESKSNKGKPKKRNGRKNNKNHQNEIGTTKSTIISSGDLAEYVPDSQTWFGSLLIRIDHEYHILQMDLKKDLFQIREAFKELQFKYDNISRERDNYLQNKTLNDLLCRRRVDFNTFVLYICSAAITGLFIGFLILSIVLCCKEGSSKSEKSHTEGKTNISEAW